MPYQKLVAFPIALAIALQLSGCLLASNGIDYSSYPIPKLPAATVTMPPAPPPPPCELPAAGQPIDLRGCKAGDTVVLRGVNFEFDKAQLTINAKTILDGVADALQARPDLKVSIDGHTDGKGSVSYNQKLSERRAASVKLYLVGRGIAAERMSTKGYGKSMPIADNATDEGRAINRRVELKVVESAPPAPPPPAVVPTVVQPSVVVLEPIPSYLQEPGAGNPTSIGVLTVVPKPIEAGPSYITAQRALPPNWTGTAHSTHGYGNGTLASAPSTSYAPPPEPAYAAPVTGTEVSIASFAFAPATLTVARGAAVTWTNHDSVYHVVKFPDQASGAIATGSSYSRTFTQPGEYPYQCGIHASMTGKIVVQ